MFSYIEFESNQKEITNLSYYNLLIGTPNLLTISSIKSLYTLRYLFFAISRNTGVILSDCGLFVFSCFINTPCVMPFFPEREYMPLYIIVTALPSLIGYQFADITPPILNLVANGSSLHNINESSRVTP